MIMSQFLTIKNKIQMALNTRSKNSRQLVTVSLDNISPFTWNWIKKDAPEGFVQTNLGVIKRSFIENYELVVQQWRYTQQYFELKYPEDMEYASSIFGQSVGLGVRVFVPCPLKKSARLAIVENSHQISVGD
jgi:hypothetical protein